MGRSSGLPVEIRSVDWSREVESVRRLFDAYIRSLGLDLAYQDVEQELARLPGKYAPPDGCALLAWRGGEAVGCVALRPVQIDGQPGRHAEMKRLYVDPTVRGAHLGQRLAASICEAARTMGYERLYLDTLTSMTAALGIYRDLGFRETAAYCFNPLAEAVFMVKDLGGDERAR